MSALKPRAILIDVIPPRSAPAIAERRLFELESLTNTYGGIVVVKLLQKRDLPNYRTYIGPGKIDDLIATAKQEKASLIVVNNLLKPRQMYELNEKLRPHKLQAWDRVDLILKIFQKHAQTVEAKLQIKLAAIDHMGPRIFGMGMEMMQQVGGVGVRGGQGETNTELMKRHLTKEAEHIKKDLKRISQTRKLHRDRRDRIGLKTVSIIGYTNAGKSSLLNAVTKKGAYVADELFATLDTRVGKVWIPSQKSFIGNREPFKSNDQRSPIYDHTPPTPVLLSDTIGFIQDLPPELIQAFRSTLEETIDADLLLHVIDASDPYLHEKIAEVETILDQLGLDQASCIYVFNKIDRVKRLAKASLLKRYKSKTPIFVSAVKKQGLDELKGKIGERLGI